jgi:hypothetical protein
MQVGKVNKERFLKNCWFAYFAAMLCWGIADYIDIVKQFQTGRFIGDFVLWYGAAVLAAKAGAGPVNVYDQEVQFRNLQRICWPHIVEQGVPVQYPPHFFAMIKPLAALNMREAYVVWCLVALPLVVFALYKLSKNLDTSIFSRAFFVLAGLASFPTCTAFTVGQTTIYQFPALAAFWLLTRSERYFSAGIFATLLSIKLQYAPCIFIVGLILGRARFLLGFAVGGLVLVLYTIASIGLQNVIGYPKALLEIETSEAGIAAPVMQNFRGEFMLFNVDVNLVHKLAGGIFILSIFIVAFIWMKAYPRLAKTSQQVAFDLCAVLTTCIMLICSPHTHFNDYMAVAIPIAFMYRQLRGSAPEDVKRKMLKYLMWGFPLFSWAPIFIIIPLVLLKIEPYFVWSIFVIAITVSLCLDQLKQPVVNQTLENSLQKE